MILPESPGRARRLAYDNYIRNRNNNRYNNIFFRGTLQSNLGTLPSNLGTLPLSYNDIFVRGTSYVRQGNVEVNDNRMERLLISDLFKNSSIYFTKDLFSCSICLNETKDTIIRKLICSHDFHINCIEMWLSNNTSCPICRYNLI